MKTVTAVLMYALGTVPSLSAAQRGAPQAPERARILSAATEIMQLARFATFITVDDDAQPQARIVDPFVPDSDMTVWIGTNPLTRKVEEIRHHPRVTLLYFNAVAQEFVTLKGTATLVSDSVEKARRWKPEWAPLYRDGPHGDGYLLVRIRPSSLEVVSQRRGLMNDPTTWRPVIISLP